MQFSLKKASTLELSGIFSRYPSIMAPSKYSLKSLKNSSLPGLYLEFGSLDPFQKTALYAFPSLSLYVSPCDPILSVLFAVQPPSGEVSVTWLHQGRAAMRTPAVVR